MKDFTLYVIAIATGLSLALWIAYPNIYHKSYTAGYADAIQEKLHK